MGAISIDQVSKWEPPFTPPIEEKQHQMSRAVQMWKVIFGDPMEPVIEKVTSIRPPAEYTLPLKEQKLQADDYYFEADSDKRDPILLTHGFYHMVPELSATQAKAIAKVLTKEVPLKEEPDPSIIQAMHEYYLIMNKIVSHYNSPHWREWICDTGQAVQPTTKTL